VIADHLGKADPVNAKTYQANADVMRQNLAQLQIDIARELAPFAESEFLVLHDAYIYFERRFGMRAHGAITTEPDVMPTVAKIKKLRMISNHIRWIVFLARRFWGKRRWV